MDLLEYIEKSRRTLSGENVLVNGVAGFVSELAELEEKFYSTSATHEESAHELGDVLFYTHALIDNLPLQMCLQDRIAMFERYYNDVEDVYWKPLSIWEDVGPMMAMIKKICSHGINPNEQYKDSGLTFNQILFKNLASIIYNSLLDVNFPHSAKESYSLEEIMEMNIEKLERRHPDKFDGSYNYSSELPLNVVPEPQF